jgi:ABC-2 type transport system permease protein
MKIIDIAIKDLRRSLRSRFALAFMFGIPLLVTSMFALMFSSSLAQGSFEVPRTSLVIANMDRDAPHLQTGSGSLPNGIHARTLSDLVVKILQSDDLANLLKVSIAPDAASARRLVDTRQAQVAVIIPAGFSRRFNDPNQQAEIEFYKDPTLTLGPGIVRAILDQFTGSLSGVKIAITVAQDVLEQENSSDLPQSARLAPAAFISQIIQGYLAGAPQPPDDPAVALLNERLPQSPLQSAPRTTSSLAAVLAPLMGAMTIFFAFFTGSSSAQSILREDEEGTLPRLFTTPTAQSTILSGKFLAVFLTVGVQITVMLLAGHFIFRIDWGEPIAVVCTALGIVCTASAFGIFANSLLHSSKQGGVIFGGLLSFTGMLGMIPVFGGNSPTASGLGSTVSLLVPQGWAILCLLQSINAAATLDVLLSALALFAWSAAFFTAGIWRFSRRYHRQ